MPTTHTTPSKSSSKSKKPTLARSASSQKPSVSRFVTPEQRRHMIEEAAYFIAEQRGFSQGDCDADWINAEAQIDKMLTKGHHP